MIDKTVFIGSILRNFPNLRTYFYTFEVNNNLEEATFLKFISKSLFMLIVTRLFFVMNIYKYISSK